MGKRRGNCEHDRLEILPGNAIRCQRCGEVIEASELFDSDEPVFITVETASEKDFSHPPLTHRIKGLP